ncbi:hypothetical protein Tco_0363016 [Tanacetum coccineum]
MVRAYSQEHIYKHPWERVTSASWRKFADPENIHTLSHILEVDTLNHKLDPEEGKLYTTRAITIHAPVPWFLRKIVGQDICHFVESTMVDAKTRSMQLATRNIGLQKYLEVQEKIRLLCHDDDMHLVITDEDMLTAVIKMGFDMDGLIESLHNRGIVAYYLLLDNRFRNTNSYLGAEFQKPVVRLSTDVFSLYVPTKGAKCDTYSHNTTCISSATGVSFTEPDSVPEMEKNDKGTTTLKSCLKASMVRNIDGKILGKDGKLLAPVRQAVRVSKVQHGMSSDNEGTEDHTLKAVDVHESSNTHDQQEPNRVKPVEIVSYASMINSDQKVKKKINFRSLHNSEQVAASDYVLPMAAVDAIKHKFDNTLVGFFVGKKVAFTLVKNYVVNTWGKFGFQNVIRDDDGFHFFKFASSSGVEKVIEQGPWMIRGTPIILTKWSPSLTISKDEVTRVPVWVKLHRVPVVAYSEDGLSIIATQIGTPITLDAFTSDMCVNPWGRIGFARALIEVSAENDLKKEVILAVPLEDGKGHTNVTIKVEYEWKPPLCLDCHCFGHDGVNCPKKIVAKVSKVSEHEQAAKENDDGFVTVTNKKKKGKSIENPHNRQIEGIKFNKPKSSFVYRPKKASSNTTSDTNQPSSSKESSDAPINLVDLNVPTESVVKLKNSFDALNEYEMHSFLEYLGFELLPETKRIGIGPQIAFRALKALEFFWGGTVTRLISWLFILMTRYTYRRDFNATLFLDDMAAGSSSIDIAMREFKQCVDEIKVSDLQQSGAHAIFQPYRMSDHAPAVLNIPWTIMKKPRPFKFSNILVSNARFKEVVSNCWNTPCNIHENVKNIRHELDRVQRDLDLDSFNDILREEEVVSVQAFNEAVLLEERFLRQKAKINWLKEGNVTNLNMSNLFSRKLEEHVAMDMTRMVSDVEIKNAMFSMEAWDIVGNDVILAVREFFINGKLLKELNHTIIALIPKVAAPTRLMHNYHLNRGSPRCAFKVDIQKAYDTVDWDFLKTCLMEFGFHDRMIGWIMECVTSTSFSICINGSLHGYFKGFKKGTSVRRRVRESEVFAYHRYCSKLDLVNLYFADDLFLFAYGDTSSTSVIMAALDDFKLVSGLTPSLPNSTAYFCGVNNYGQACIASDFFPFEEVDLRLSILVIRLFHQDLYLEIVKKLLEKVGCIQSHLADLISSRGHFLEGFNKGAKVCDLILTWYPRWATSSWLCKYRVLIANVCHCLVPNSHDLLEWRNEDGLVCSFSAHTVWNTIRARVPKTQDTLRHWDNMIYALVTCSLCETKPDSHDHLFFECPFSQQHRKDSKSVIALIGGGVLLPISYCKRKMKSRSACDIVKAWKLMKDFNFLSVSYVLPSVRVDEKVVLTKTELKYREQVIQNMHRLPVEGYEKLSKIIDVPENVIDVCVKYYFYDESMNHSEEVRDMFR